MRAGTSRKAGRWPLEPFRRRFFPNMLPPYRNEHYAGSTSLQRAGVIRNLQGAGWSTDRRIAHTAAMLARAGRASRR